MSLTKMTVKVHSGLLSAFNAQLKSLRSNATPFSIASSAPRRPDLLKRWKAESYLRALTGTSPGN